MDPENPKDSPFTYSQSWKKSKSSSHLTYVESSDERKHFVFLKFLEVNLRMTLLFIKLVKNIEGK